MFTLLLILFMIVSFFMAFIILLQQGKGDMGLGSMGGTQMLFGGSGGQEFFEKLTWVFGSIFIFGALGLAVLKAKEVRSSRLSGVTLKQIEAKASKIADPKAETPASSMDTLDTTPVQKEDAQPAQTD